MPFHRLTAPGYVGGLPGTHDYINDPTANGDPGVPAPADGKKAFAPAPGDQNEGTYFVAFSEPAQAININRPASALAQNTDFLDDVIHRDLAIPAFFDVAAGHGGTISLALTGDVFVGTAGTPNNQGVRDQLIQVVDPVTGIPVVLMIAAGPPATFAPVAASLVHDGSSNNQIGNGFYTNPTINFAVSIPSATAFRVLFHVRGRLKDQPSGVLTRVRAEPVGLGSILATIQHVLDDAAFKHDNNDFASDKLQGFSGPISLAGLVTSYKPALTPVITSEDLSQTHILLSSWKVFTSPAVYARIYSVNSTIDNGFEITVNARWVQSASPSWASDSSARIASRLKIGGGGTILTSARVAFHSLPTGLATWNEAGWRDISAGIVPTNALEILSGSFISYIYSTSTPLLKTDRLVADDTTDSANNPYRLIFDFAAGTTLPAGNPRIRLYVGNDDTAGISATKHYGNLFITHNASWNPVTLLWSRDNTTIDSQAIALRAGSTGSNYSGLTGAGIANFLTGHQVSALMYLIQPAGAGSWGAGSWSNIPSRGDLGHLRIPGEYAYTSSAGGKEMVLFSDPMTWVGGGYWTVAINGVDTPRATSSSINQFLHIPLVLPPYALITSVEVRVDPVAAGGGQRLNFDVYEYEAAGATVTNLGGDDTDGTGNIQTLDVSTGLFPRQSGAGTRYYVRVQHSNVSSSETVLYVRVFYKAPINVPGIGAPDGTFAPYDA